MKIEPVLPPTKSRAEVLTDRLRDLFAPAYPVTCRWCGHGHDDRDVCPRCRTPQRLRADTEAT
jgi:rubrerythrin